MHVNGACLCGAITLEAEVEEDKVAVCHCTDCQRLSGSAFRGGVPALRGTIVMTGSPKTYVKVADSGRRRLQVFCPDCGTPLYADDPEGAGAYISLRIGFLDQRALLVPRAQIWRRSALEWVDRLNAIPGLAAGFPTT